MRLSRPTPRRHGYTLTELLLAIVIVLGLVGAVVFNFSTVGRTAALDEGTTQVEALFRFARAHAASSGKQVRILFPEAETGDNAEVLAAEAPGATVRVICELDPLGAPGVFTDLPEAANYIASISDLVRIQQVQAGETNAVNSADGTPASEPSADAPRNAFSTECSVMICDGRIGLVIIFTASVPASSAARSRSACTAGIDPCPSGIIPSVSPITWWPATGPSSRPPERKSPE